MSQTCAFQDVFLFAIIMLPQKGFHWKNMKKKKEDDEWNVWMGISRTLTSNMILVKLKAAILNVILVKLKAAVADTRVQHF